MRVALFVSCLVDLFRPSAAYASLKLLEQSGCTTSIPQNQTCCGQPAYNNGDRNNARQLAIQVIDTFSDFDYVVVPSGSCAGMVKCHYPALFVDDKEYFSKATRLAERCYELTSFLADVVELKLENLNFSEKVTYHDSCSCQRELKVKEQPRKLLKAVNDLELIEMKGTEECCGFGGTFCVKYDELSGHMVDKKVDSIKQTGANILLAADLGCLMNIAGRIKRRSLPVKVYHVAEILADMIDDDGIGGE